jgi:hypothetical protein
VTATAKHTEADWTRAYAAIEPDDGHRAMRIAELLADEREYAARQCDEVAKGPSRTPAEKAVARQLAKRIREGRP